MPDKTTYIQLNICCLLSLAIGVRNNLMSKIVTDFPQPTSANNSHLRHGSQKTKLVDIAKESAN